MNVGRSVGRLLKYSRVFYAWSRKQTVLPYLPEDISVEVTNVCNFKCAYCPQSDPDHFKKVRATTLKPDQADVLLSRLRKSGVRTNVLHFTLDGEPFVNRRFHEICKVAHAYGFDNIIFSTNGEFATLERVLELPQSSSARYTFCIDFCDDKEYFETYRGTPGSWDTVKNNINAIVHDHRLDNVMVHVTDITSFKIHDRAALQTHFDGLRKMFDGTRVAVASRVFHNATGYLRDMGNGTPRSYNLCPYPWTSLVVASNGDVVACCRDLQHKTVLGNLFKQDLGEIWNGEKYQQLRRSLAEGKPEGACKDCDMPYEKSKFSARNIIATGLIRLQVLE